MDYMKSLENGKIVMVTREWVNGTMFQIHWEWDKEIKDWKKYVPESPPLQLEERKSDVAILPRNW